jgi:putative membrane protein
MKNLAQSFLNSAEQDKITQCVQQAERRTSGEIVPMVVSTSHDYPMAAVTGATFIALPTALLVTRLIGAYLWLTPDQTWLFLSCFIILYFAAYRLVNSIPWLKRQFLSPRQIDEEVREAAVTAFFTEELYRTAGENGILLFISIFERKVWVLGDRGINAKISLEHWQSVVDTVTEGIQRGRQCEAICSAIEQIGTILEKHFPIEADDKDELHNLIIR